ncbi:DUF4097 family beta strand repeat-containing protein [Indiicoccus explosivorum]|uniref:DUF4097 family beta strand repeat-containing protein n=1 Tax=Indiicoccus explosivorum TaxID=1917864 RepID=UPI000B446533|nr:DUF4097 family beta strand repeat-containing protein [Indiicoccus explosivorum]
MGDEKERILDMVEKGTITAQEAVELLKAMDSKQDPPVMDAYGGRSEYRERQGRSKFGPDDFVRKLAKDFSRDFSRDFSKEFKRDYSKDFNQFGDKMMRFMQESFGKLKNMDFESPLGEAVTFTQTFSEENAEVEEIIVDISNGQLEVFPLPGNEVKAECVVKAYRAESEAQAKQDFFEKFVFVADGRKVRIISDLKTTQVNLVLYVPEKDYELLTARLFNGGFTMKRLNVGKLRVKTANGKIEVKDGTVQDAELETANGAIQVQEMAAGELEAETFNGRVYIDGDMESVEAKSLNGNVVVTTRSDKARKIEAKTVAGNVEIYVPKHLPLKGEVTSNLGRMDVYLEDAERVHETEQLLQKSIKFTKNTEADSEIPLLVFGETKTGSILVRYFTAE